MNTFKRLLLGVGVPLGCVMVVTAAPAAEPLDPWDAVDQAMEQGLPKTALEKVESLRAEAERGRAWGQLAKAIALQIELQGQIEGNQPEEKIRRLEQELGEAPAELVPLMEAIQANWFWEYFQRNRWRILQRSATRTEASEDFTTWDLRRLFAEIDRRFQRALASKRTLQQTPVATLDGVLVAGAVPDRYRPMLYDFIAHQALEFYTSGEQAGARPEDDFVLSADSPIFDAVEEFLAWRPEVSTGNPYAESPLLRAIALYQNLLKFHAQDADPSARADADLARLQFGWNHAAAESKDARYAAALKRFVDTWADHEVAALALHRWAELKRFQDSLLEAHALAARGSQTHPDSPGGRLCYNLIQEIEAPSVQLSTERIWNEPWPTLEIEYRNLTRVYFRAVAWDWDDFLQRDHSRPEQLSKPEERQELLRREPAQTWEASLEPTNDYRSRIQEIAAPTPLAPGFYFLLASFDPSFSDQNNQVVFTDFWVSDLALVIRTHENSLEGFVLKAQTGEPLTGAEVLAWHLDRQGNRIPNAPMTRTDTNGFFRVPGGPSDSSSLVRARYRFQNTLHELGSLRQYRAREVRTRKVRPQTVFFTDRALYRPGQTILYKGLCLLADPDKDDYRVLPGQKLSVILRDPNGRELARADRVCGRNGSFFGQFTAPRGSVSGRCFIQVAQGPIGSSAFNVEEYKRPKFSAALNKPTAAARLGDIVTITGKAESYTGAAIDGAQVSYRVVREVRWPEWWGWLGRPDRFGGNSQEMTHGTTTTAVDGSFSLDFRAVSDPDVAEADEPVFEFTVHAEVTDSAGETRTAEQVVRAGYTALRASIGAERWATTDRPLQLDIRTESLDGEPQSAEGVLRIHRLKAPETVHRAPLTYGYRRGIRPEDSRSDSDLSDPAQWELGAVLMELGFTTDTNGVAQVRAALDVGVYRAVLETQDRYGKKVTAIRPLGALDPAADRLRIRVPQIVFAPETSVEPGGHFSLLWGTGYTEGRAFIEIENRGQLIRRFWTDLDRTQLKLEQAVTESMRGGFYVHITQVRENRAYLETLFVKVPWSNKRLDVSWEHLTSKLEPNQRETWTAIIKKRAGTANDGGWEPAVAELVATLYDASLDAYVTHRWPRSLGRFRVDQTRRRAQLENSWRPFKHVQGYWPMDTLEVNLTYRGFAPFLQRSEGLYPSRGRGVITADMRFGLATPELAPNSLAMAMEAADASMERMPMAAKGGAGLTASAIAAEPESPESTAPDLSQVSARKNLQETAAFFPQLISDSNGVIRITFTMPEALTTWRLMGLAHDRELRSGFIEATAVTSKDLMVQPNPPRFLREGDILEFSVKVSNQSDQTQKGLVRLNLSEARTGDSADRLLDNRRPEQEFEIPARESRSFGWRLSVPDHTGFLTYKAVASSGRLSDGEEGYLPVLSRRIFVTESLPLPIRGPGTKEFSFEKLLASDRSKTLRHQGVTVQMVSNPAWYAVLALPFLMEFPHECSEQVFNRFYANTLARFIAMSDPNVRRVFDRWRDTPALDSPLEKNQDLKAVLIEETPWLRQAQNESQARRNVGLLFDDQRLVDETDNAFQKLLAMQLEDGTWSWFPGGRRSDYITLYIATGFGRLRHLEVDVDTGPALRAWQRLDVWMTERHQKILERPKPEDYVPSPIDALQLYGRSFFLGDVPINEQHRPAADFFLKQARRHWLKTSSRQTQGHLALALHRWGGQENIETARAILRSLKEFSVTDDEMGRFWRDTELSWWWYRAPIETQALLIEAFDEVAGDTNAVEELKVWMLKQKQTQDWKTTKATADAIYALLLRGAELLASTNLVQLTVGELNLTPSAEGRRQEAEGRNAASEPGTGFYEHRFSAAEVVPEMGEITVRKIDPGVAWGSIHWQYLEDMSNVTAHTNTPLQLRKALYVRRASSQGPVLEEVSGAIAVGDELVTRIELRVDRDMEYVHLKDQRGSGTEPVSVLSRYRYQDGLAYYESTRDTGSHFFIEYLPKGTYVFEYSVRAQHRGEYQTGIAEIQCMYAPEFNSHSESLRLRVR